MIKTAGIDRWATFSEWIPSSRIRPRPIPATQPSCPWRSTSSRARCSGSASCAGSCTTQTVRASWGGTKWDKKRELTFFFFYFSHIFVISLLTRSMVFSSQRRSWTKASVQFRYVTTESSYISNEHLAAPVMLWKTIKPLTIVFSAGKYIRRRYNLPKRPPSHSPWRRCRTRRTPSQGCGSRSWRPWRRPWWGNRVGPDPPLSPCSTWCSGGRSI